jgi:hypothetical protein
MIGRELIRLGKLVGSKDMIGRELIGSRKLVESEDMIVVGKIN